MAVAIVAVAVAFNDHLMLSLLWVVKAQIPKLPLFKVVRVALSRPPLAIGYGLFTESLYKI